MAIPVISVEDAIIDEAAGEAVFTIILDRPSTGTVSMDYQTDNGTALAGSDYHAATGTLNFAPGETSKTIKVALVNDNVIEDSELFNLKLSNINGATAPDRTGTAIIAASDAPESAIPLITVEDVIASEGQGSAVFVIRLSAPSTQTVSVGYTTADGTAFDGIPDTDEPNPDYASLAGILTFAPGETVKTVSVKLLDDARAELTENFQLGLIGPVNAALGRAVGTATVLDNELAGIRPVVYINDVVIDEFVESNEAGKKTTGVATFTITLDRPSGDTVVLNYETRDGDYGVDDQGRTLNAIAGEDYRATSGQIVFAPGETVKTVAVSTIRPPSGIVSEQEADETFDLVLSDPVGASLPDAVGTATITYDTPLPTALPVITIENVSVNEGQGYVDFVVRLDGYSESEITVKYDLVGGTAVRGADYIYQSGTLTFAPTGIDIEPGDLNNDGKAEEEVPRPGETVKTVRVKLIDDSRAEPPENFRLELSSPTNANFGNPSLKTIGATATVEDNDPAVPTPDATVADLLVDEAAGKAVFTVTLDQPSTETVTITYETRDGSAISSGADPDYTAASGQLVFTPGETSKTVEVDLSDDSLAEPSETFGLALTNFEGAVSSDPSATAIIAASDAASGAASNLFLTVEDTLADENQGYANFIVRLNAPGTGTVNVDYATAPGTAVAGANGDFTEQTGTLTFNPGETVKIVPVKLLDDARAETTESLQLALSNPVNAALSRPLGNATVYDDDRIADRPTLTISNIVVDMAAGEAIFVIALDRASANTVTLDYATADDSAVAGSDYTSMNGTLSFTLGEIVKTVRVPLLSGTHDTDLSFNLNLKNVVGATAPDQLVGTATLAANDAASAAISTLSVENTIVGEGQGYVDFVVRLSAPSTNTITVDYALSDGTAWDGIPDTDEPSPDYGAQTGTLRFAPGETVKTVRVALVDDTASETTEGLQLKLSNPQGFHLPNGIPSNAWLGNSIGTAIIMDNDGAKIPALSVGDAMIDEATGEAVFTIMLDRPSTGTVTLNYATQNQDGSAVAGSDYVAASGTLSFAPGEIAKTVRIALIDDTVRESNEIFNLVLSDIARATAHDTSAIAVIAASDVPAAATPVIRVEDANARENQGYADFVVRLDAPSTKAVTVGYSTVAGTAVAGTDGDFLSQTGTLAFAPGETVKTVRIALADDTVGEDTERFHLNLHDPVNAALDPAHASGSAVVADDDVTPAIPILSIGDLVVDEAAHAAVFTITLDRPSTGTVTMSYATRNGNAEAGSDYIAASGTLSFAPGEIAKSVRVALIDDAVGESSETFELVLSDIAGAAAPDRQGVAFIAANDYEQTNTPVVSTEDTFVSEDQGYVDFVVRLNAPSANTIVVDYETADGTAVAISPGDESATGDFYGQTGTLSFAPGEIVKTVRILLADDTTVENTESFQLKLTNARAFDLLLNTPANATVGRAVGAATVVDNDIAADAPLVKVSDILVDEAAREAVFTISLHRPGNLTSTVSLDYQTGDGTALAGSDYIATRGTLSFAPGETAKTVRVALVDDPAQEPSETFGLALSNVIGAVAPDSGATAVIGGNDAAVAATPTITVEDTVVGESQGYIDFVVRLDAPSTEIVAIDYATVAGSAKVDDDFLEQTGTLRFAPGETVKIVRVTGTDGTIAAPAESFHLQLSNPANAVVGRSVGTATIVDQDSAQDRPMASVGDILIDETAQEAVFVVRLDRPVPSTGLVSLNYHTADGTARAGSDYTAVSGALTFAPGEIAKTVRVPLFDDTARESGETFKLVLSSPQDATLADPDATAVIATNDAASLDTPRLRVEDTVAGEDQGYADFVVRLNGPSTQAVSVGYALVSDPEAGDTAAADSDYIEQTGTLSFAPGEIAKTVRVALADDTVAEPGERFRLVLDTQVNATLDRDTGIATILDNDAATDKPTVSVGGISVDEAAGEAVFTIVLDRPSTGAVSMDYTTGSNGTAQAGSDYTAVSGALSFAPGEVVKTVRVPVLEDIAGESNETFRLVLSNITGGTLGQDTGVATLADNDSGVISVSHAVIDETNGTATFVVTLDKPSTNTVSVTYATQDGSAVSIGAEADYVAASGTLGFEPGEIAKTITVTVNGNSGADAPSETFDLVLSNPVSVTLAAPTATAVIVDTSPAHVVIPVVSVEDVVAGEGQGYADFVIRLSAPSTNVVSVPYQSFQHTAEETDDFGPTGLQTLTFAPGETVKTVRVAIVDDGEAELAESFQLQLNDPTNEDFPLPVNAALGRPFGVGTILDNDTVVDSPIMSVSDPVIDETGREVLFTITLDRASAGTVAVSYATRDGTAISDLTAAATPGQTADYAATTGALSFAPGEMVKTVRVPIFNDALSEDSETFHLLLSGVTGASAPEEPDGTAVITRSDIPVANTPTISVEDASFGEAQGWGDFIVRLSAPSSNLVSVGYALAPAAAFTPDDYADQSGILTFAPGETVKTVRVSIVDDNGPTFDETFQLDLKSPVNGLLGRSTAFATIVNDDGYAGQPALSIGDPVVDETAGEAVFTLTLTGPSSLPVTLNYATNGGNAEAGLDYTPVNGFLSFAPGETVKTVRVPILSDDLAEASESFSLMLTNVVGVALPNPNGATPFPIATATIAANSGASAIIPLLSVENLSVGENQGYADFVVRLDAPSAATVSVSYATASGTAEDGGAGGDYWGQTGTLSFAPGETVKTVRVSLYDDTPTVDNQEAIEITESFRLALSNPVNAGLGQSSGIATVLDNDGATVIPAATVDDPVVDETAHEAVFTVTLDRPSAGVVTLEYTTRNDNAVAGSDYVAAGGALSFAPGEMVKTVRVPLLEDGLAEVSETFNLVLSNSAGATLPDPVGAAVIAANDGAKIDTPLLGVEDATASEARGYVDFLVRLQAPSAQIVSVDYTLSGATGANVDIAGILDQAGRLSFTPGETVKTVRVLIPDNATADPTEALALRLANPVNAVLGRPEAIATLLDDDRITGTPGVSLGDLIVDEATGEALFTVTLDRPSTGVVSLSYATENGSAVAAGANPDFTATSGTLNFVPGELVKTVRVLVNPDTLAEGSETFNLALSNVTGATVVDPRGTAVIAANSIASAMTPIISVEDAVAGEQQGYADFLVRLDLPSANIVTVAYTTSDGGAIAGATGDYLGQTGTLAFAPGETVKTVRVALVDDTADELTESFQFTLNTPANAALGRSVGVATVLDNDRATNPAADPIAPVLSVGDFMVDEASGEAVFTIAMDRPTTGTVTLSYATADGSAQAGSDYLAADGTLGFAPGEIAKTVRVALVNDAVRESSENFNLVLSNVTGATLVDPNGTATLAANDANPLATPSLYVEDTVAGEGQAYADFQVRLDAPSTQAISVGYTLAGDTAAATSDYIDQTGTLSFAPGEMVKTVRVALADDTVAEPGESFQLVLDNPVNATLDRDTGIATIVDNDAATGTPMVSIGDVTVGEVAGAAVFTLTLDRPSTGVVSMRYATADGGATAGADYTATDGMLSFAPGEVVKTVRVPVLDDIAGESNETFDLLLSNVTGATLAHTGGVATVVDNEPIAFIDDPVVDETAGLVRFAVILDRPALYPVSIGFRTVDGTATGSDDYTATTGGISFQPGETAAKIIEIPIVSDTKSEGAENFSVELFNASGAALGDPIGRATINASNGAPVVAQPIPDQAATSNAFFKYTVSSTAFTDPDAGDTLAYSARRADGSALPSWLSFDPATRIFAGTAASKDVGAFDIKVTATDSAFASTFDIFTLTVTGSAGTTQTTTTGTTQTTGATTTQTAGATQATENTQTAEITQADTNHAPITGDSTVNVQDKGTYTFTADDFPFGDVDVPGSSVIDGRPGFLVPSDIQSVSIDSLPLEGQLRLNGQAVQAGQGIARADLDAGHLTYSAPGTVAGDWTQHFAFRVGDGQALSANTGSFTINLTPTGAAKLGTDGGDLLNGKSKADLLIGHDGNDTMNGKGGNDQLFGGVGQDVLKGGAGKDALSGGTGNDTLYGQAGRDTLIGGAGNDLLNGGGGKDTYRYLAGQLGIDDLQAGDHDTIQATKGDTIAFNPSLWAHLTQDGTALGALAGQVLGQQIDAGTNIAFVGRSLQIDVNGDGVFQADQDMSIEILGQTHKVSVDSSGGLLLLG
jgi:hypothetical protein